MMKPLFLLALVGSLGGCGAGGDGFYAHFEPFPLVSSQATGFSQLVGFGDGVFAVSGGELHPFDGAVVLSGVRDVAVVGDVLVAITATGVESSADGVSFSQVSDEVFDVLTSVDESLIGARLVALGTMGLWRSEDKGQTWTSLGEDFALETTVEVGSDSVGLSAGVDGLVWARVSGDEDIGPNWSFTGNTYEIRGQAVTHLPAVLGQVLPSVVSVDGLAVVNIVDSAEGPDGNYDNLPIALVNRFVPAMSFAGETRIHFAASYLPQTRPVPRVYATDGQGRLIVALDDQLMRTVLPLSLENNERNTILAGPGCSKRDTFSGSNSSERPEISVENASGGPVTVWNLDDQHRWFQHAEVAAGETAMVEGFALVEGGFLMVLRENGDCAVGQHMREGVGSISLTIEDR